MKNNKLLAKRVFCYLFIFLVLFQPPILPFNILHLLSVVSVAILFIHRKDALALYKDKAFRWFIGFNLIYFIYATVVSIVTSSFISGFYSGFLFAIELPICVIGIFVLCKKCELPLMQTVIYVGLIQAIIAIIVLLIPGLQGAIIKFYITRRFPAETEWFIGKRFFGFSTQLSYTMPIVQTILAVLVIRNLKNKKDILKTAVFALLLILSAIINARSTIVILLIGIVYLLYEKRAYLKVIKLHYYLCALAGVGVFIIIGRFLSPSTFTWVMQGLGEIFFIFTGNYEGSYFDIIFSNFFFLPDRFHHFIFGTGINVFNQTVNGLRSDVGFIIDLWYAGMIGCILKYIGTVGAFLQRIKKDSFIYFLLAVLLVANIKGIAFENNELMAFISIYLLTLQETKGN